MANCRQTHIRCVREITKPSSVSTVKGLGEERWGKASRLAQDHRVTETLKNGGLVGTFTCRAAKQVPTLEVLHFWCGAQVCACCHHCTFFEISDAADSHRA